ncbi:MAG: plasmid partitioning protein RepB C-terminal domain-containing protein [Tabrizicola sp.]|uniref:ParB/RepB/Spo0J family partition protein n=1 Tax=Tabrizicola sp. TaxID=2005166 RepID=UPI0027347E79|nr:plasmid partitioning protein RepB C-terminal domain-containing protein [Tabrizicola sp.]MDP3264476.1 plasmid partitioning protein RepB C-terminal domain-containing protein [Tabrizicola sp.]MDZ4070142.1 plasmid partitioning protein RepB C-terminal domain-containing protein [Tabrizicola sp.]
MSEVEMRDEVQMIPISAITVENPRERSEKTFRALVDSIGKVGLKKPITVARVDEEGGVSYRLVCGQGRMEAYVALGETHIPAIVVDASEAERLLRSVIENIARRQQRPLELLQDIAVLRDRGYSDHQIADKTGLSLAYVHEIGELIANGEERLLIAVETGQMPLSVALYITRAEEKDVQKALEAAYASGELRGKKLLEARRLVELRHRHGKQRGGARNKQPRARMTSAALVKAYRAEAERQQDMVRRAQSTRSSLLFLDAAFQSLLKDENFLTLLRAEGLYSVPRMIVDGLQEPRS